MRGIKAYGNVAELQMATLSVPRAPIIQNEVYKTENSNTISWLTTYDGGVPIINTRAEFKCE